MKKKLKLLKSCLSNDREENEKQGNEDHYTEMVETLK